MGHCFGSPVRQLNPCTLRLFSSGQSCSVVSSACMFIASFSSPPVNDPVLMLCSLAATRVTPGVLTRVPVLSTGVGKRP